MTNSAHTQELQTLQTKDFDFVFVEDALLSRYKGQSVTADNSTPTPSAFDRESLQRFHDEFKGLVMASNQAAMEQEELAFDDITLNDPIEPHEIEWLDWRTDKAQASHESKTKAPAQQAVKALSGLPIGALPPIDSWVVKAIVVLVCLNLAFAGLIATETRISAWFHWLHL